MRFTHWPTRYKMIEPKAHGIGASDLRTAAGKNPQKTRQELYLQKLGLIDKDDQTDAMQAGNRGELILDFLFRRDFLPEYEAQGYEYTYQPGLVRSSKYPGLVCKPDGVLVNKAGHKIIVEFKTVQNMEGIETKGNAPDHWIYQSYGMMECCEAQETHFFVFSKIDLEIIPLPPFPANAQFQAVLGKIAQDFWTMILENRPPSSPFCSGWNSPTLANLLMRVISANGTGTISLHLEPGSVPGTVSSTRYPYTSDCRPFLSYEIDANDRS